LKAGQVATALCIGALNEVAKSIQSGADCLSLPATSPLLQLLMISTL